MKPLTTRLLLAAAICITLVPANAFSGTSMKHLEELARNGTIDPAAPIKADLEITIDTPPVVVWHLLTDIDEWPKWQTAISRVEVANPIQTGTPFVWVTDGHKIESRIERVMPLTSFAWVGTFLNAKAIHVWNLRPTPDGKTIVRTTESMNGALLALFFSSRQLEHSDRKWLNDLKAAAEK